MELYHKKIKEIYKKSFFSNPKVKRKFNFEIIKKNKLNKSLIENYYSKIKREYSKNVNKTINEPSFKIRVKKTKINRKKEIFFQNINLNQIDCKIEKIKVRSIINPNVRENPFICYNSNNLYLFGGFSTKMHYDLWRFNMLQNEWVLLVNNFNQLNSYKNLKVINKGDSLYVYGIKLFYNKKTFKKVKYNILLKVNLNNLNAKEIIFHKHKIIYDYEIAWISNNLVCKFGGKYTDLNFNSNLYIYNLENQNSIKFKFLKNLFSKGIFKSKIVSIFKNEGLNINDFLKYFINIKEKEGFYVFGGYDIENNYYEGLYYINLKNRYLNINKIKINGKPPLPRIGHEMVFVKSISSIIIYGGISYMGNILTDELIIYNIYSNNIFYSKPKSILKKYCFGSTSNNEEIFLFGGLNLEGFCNKNLYNIKLNKYN